MWYKPRHLKLFNNFATNTSFTGNEVFPLKNYFAYVFQMEGKLSVGLKA